MTVPSPKWKWKWKCNGQTRGKKHAHRIADPHAVICQCLNLPWTDQADTTGAGRAPGHAPGRPRHATAGLLRAAAGGPPQDQSVGAWRLKCHCVRRGVCGATPRLPSRASGSLFRGPAAQYEHVPSTQYTHSPDTSGLDLALDYYPTSVSEICVTCIVHRHIAGNRRSTLKETNRASPSANALRVLCTEYIVQKKNEGQQGTHLAQRDEMLHLFG